MKYGALISAVAMLATTSALAQPGPTDRIQQIRTMYAASQQMLANQSDQTDWKVTSTIHRNESAVGVVRYEMEFFPLSLISPDAYDMVRGKRYVTVQPAEVFEILYDANGAPAFYFERNTDGESNESYEYRIYWNEQGEVVEYLPQHVVNGRKERIESSEPEMYYRTGTAYRFALQEHALGIMRYEADRQGRACPYSPGMKSEAGLFHCVTRLYEAYFNPTGDEAEDDPGADIEGLGKMYRFVTDEFNTLYCTVQSKSASTDDLYIDYDVWVNAQERLFDGISGVRIRKFSLDKAVVAVQMSGDGNSAEVVLQMCYDADQDTWLVSDFLNPSSGKSYVKGLEEFLRK